MTNRVVIFCCRPFPNILKYIQGSLIKPSNNMENKTPLHTYWKVQLVCKKVPAHSSLEPPLEYNQDQMLLTNQGSLWPFLTMSGVTERLYSFRLVLQEKTGKEISESWRLELLEKFSANNYALSEAEDNNSGLLNRYSRFDFVENTTGNLLKVQEPGFWEVTDCFVLLAYASLVASRTLLNNY